MVPSEYSEINLILTQNNEDSVTGNRVLTEKDNNMLCFVQGDFQNNDEAKCRKFLKKSRSSGNFSSQTSQLLGARSAPGTPIGTSETSSGQSQNSQIQRSPSHSGFTQRDKASLKHLSTSTPAMTAQGHLGEPPSPKSSSRSTPKTRTTSKARQKKFLRHFPNVDEDEKVLNHYSCALIGDILLQGHLYITKNYFAFYSNVFGYVTKLLIPILTVEDITKEKTARIIPNAVGITTGEDKHVFGSLMSRDSTLAFMRTVWEKAKSDNEELNVPEILAQVEDQDSSESADVESGRESPGTDIDKESYVRKRINSKEEDGRKNSSEDGSKNLLKKAKDALEDFKKLPRQSMILFATTLLLILLFLSAAILLYRISKIQNQYSLAFGDKKIGEGDDIYSDILQWQNHLHSKSAGAVHTYLDNNLDQIAKVRQSLEALSTLLVQNAGTDNDNSDEHARDKNIEKNVGDKKS